MKTEHTRFTIQTYTQKEMAACYQVTSKTFRRWLGRASMDLGPRVGNCYSPSQVKRIVETLGEP